MPHHQWGDNWNGWNDLYAAIRLVQKIWKWGRIGNHGKEKYGTFRDQLCTWDGTLTELIYPGYYYIPTPIWFYCGLDRKIIKPAIKYTGLAWCIRRYQRFVYNLGVQIACRKYPNVVDELVSDLDGYKMVTPGIFGKVCGKTIHNKYWRIIK